MEANDLLKRRMELCARLTPNRWYSISNQAGPVAEIRIYDEIWWGGVNAADFARDLDAITAPEILVAINSPGGDVFDAIAIYNSLRTHPARITTRVDGIAASAASVIVQAGDKRIMMSAAQVMIHEPWGVAVGPASEIREFADLLDRQTDVLAGIYAARSGKDADHFRALMAGGSDKWFSADETVAEGLADEISDPDPKADPSPQNKRLVDEVQEAVVAVSAVLESVDRVAALRAEKGKQLSGVNRANLEELDGCLARLRALLDTPNPTDHGDALAREYARFVAITVGV